MQALELIHVSKKFKKGELHNSLREAVPALLRSLLHRRTADDLEQQEFWAVCDVSFAVERGEVLGVIGHNGAGKTTLLRTIAGIYEPTGGALQTAGRIMPLFNLMEGMMPDATGREFIHVRGILLGLEPSEIDALTAEVIDFCELGDYIDMPVRMYSTGMLVRLAFAIATSATADILLFDELIGAGDARFVEKARERLQRFIDRFRAKASKASQAQSRLKRLAKLAPIAEIVEERVAPFLLLSPARPLAPRRSAVCSSRSWARRPARTSTRRRSGCRCSRWSRCSRSAPGFRWRSGRCTAACTRSKGRHRVAA